MRLFRTATLAFILANAPVLLNAQSTTSTPTIEYGRTTFQLNAQFATFLQSTGAAITDLQGNPLQNNSFTFKAVAGAIDVTTAAGEVEHSGGLQIVAAGAVARIENFTLDTSNPAAPVITAQIIYADHFAARIPLFSVQPPPSFSLPLAAQNGVLQVNGLGLTLAPAAASTLSSLFGATIPAGVAVGTANVYAVLAASN